MLVSCRCNLLDSITASTLLLYKKRDSYALNEFFQNDVSLSCHTPRHLICDKAVMNSHEVAESSVEGGH